MAAHQQSTSETEEDNSKEQSIPTYEDKLVGKLEEGAFSPEQQLSLQTTLALLFGASTHALEIRSSLKLLRGEIDINKLVTDPKYKAEIERAVQLTNRYGRIVKKGDLIDKVPKIERAIERTNACHSKLNATKSALLQNDEIYLNRLKETYRLDDKQLNAIKDGAWARVKENPSLSMKDALRIEAEGFSVKQVTKEVENENKGKKLTREQKEAQVKQKLADKQLQYEAAVKTRVGQAKTEEEKIKEIISAHIEENKQILAAQPQPTPAPTPQPVVSAPPPTITPAPIVVPPPSIPSSPVSMPKFSMPSFSLPVGLTQRLGNVLGGVGGGLKSFLGTGGGLSKGLSGLANLAKVALPKLASVALPPLGAVLTAITTLDALTGGLITKGAAILVGAVAAIIIIVPIIMGVGVFSYVTGNNPITLSSSNGKIISWKEFDKQYLTRNTGNDLRWQQFEKSNLTLQKQYLSLEKTGL